MLELPTSHNPNPSGMNVLIVEDDDDDASEIVEVLLTIDSVCQVSRASNGEEADQWFALAEERPDLVICDINMPRLNGFDFLTRLRASQEKPPPVVMLTSSNRNGDFSRSQVRKAATYIQKPNTYSGLVEVLNQLMDCVSSGQELPSRLWPSPDD